MNLMLEFAHKWADKFKDKKISEAEFTDRGFGDECVVLGFEMDCGESFRRMYGTAEKDADELEKIINSVTDINLLGSAILSRWRYFSHWIYEPITEPHNRKWFILALERMAVLAENN